MSTADLIRRTPPGPATEPVRTAYSRAEATDRAKDWMAETFGLPRDLDEEARERWHERMGLLVHFLTDLFPAE